MNEMTDERLAEIRELIKRRRDHGYDVYAMPDLLAEVERLKAKLAARISWLAKEDQAHEVTIVERDQLKARINADAQYIAEVIAEREKARAVAAEVGSALDREHGFVKRHEATIADLTAELAKRERETILAMADWSRECQALREHVAELKGATVVVECTDPEHQERDQLRARVAELETQLTVGQWAPKMVEVLAEVAIERKRQDAKWGEQNHPDGTGGPGRAQDAESARRECKRQFAEGTGAWLDVLEEEVSEAYAEDAPVKLRAELVQVAAVAVAWIEAIDRRPVAAVDPDGCSPFGCRSGSGVGA